MIRLTSIWIPLKYDWTCNTSLLSTTLDYLRGSRSHFELKKVRRDNGDMDCVFLDREKIPGKAICSLYGARPGQCRTWPFWPELLESEKTWNNAKFGSEGCAGIGKGIIVPYEEIIRQRDLPMS